MFVFLIFYLPFSVVKYSSCTGIMLHTSNRSLKRNDDTIIIIGNKVITVILKLLLIKAIMIIIIMIMVGIINTIKHEY